MTYRDILVEIRQLPQYVLTEACGVHPTSVDANAVRQEFISWVARRPGQYKTWEHAWNDWTGAAEHRRGRIRMHVLCPDCRGCMYSTKHGRVAPCTTCVGRRKVFCDIPASWLQTDAG